MEQRRTRDYTQVGVGWGDEQLLIPWFVQARARRPVGRNLEEDSRRAYYKKILSPRFFGRDISNWNCRRNIIARSIRPNSFTNLVFGIFCRNFVVQIGSGGTPRRGVSATAAAATHGDRIVEALGRRQRWGHGPD